MKFKKEKEDKRKSHGKEKLAASRLKTGGIIAALAASAAVFAAMVQTEKNVLTQYEKGSIYVAAAAIPRGQVITEDNYDRYFKLQQLDKSCIPETALSSPEQAKDLMAVWDIEQGVLLTDGMFRHMDTVLEEMEKPVIAGFKAEDIYQVAGGVLRAGDRVNIYSVREDGTGLVWERVFVQQVFDAAGNAVPNGDESAAAQRINIYLDEADVEEFYGQLASGSLRVVKLIQ